MISLTTFARARLAGALLAGGCLPPVAVAAAAGEAPVAVTTATDAARPAAAPTLRVQPHRPEAAPPIATPPATRLHPDAAAGLAMPYTGTPVDATTYHYDGLRTGWNPTETDLTQATVKSGRFGLLQTLAVDGSVFAQPLLVSGFAFPDGSTHDVLVAVTAHNSVYAWDARSYAPLWHVNLGASQKTADIGCTDVNPEYGISSTPVIVRGAGGKTTIYLVSATEPTAKVFHTQLHALDLATGADTKPAVEIAPTTTLADGSVMSFDPKNQWSRSGLGFNNGSLYIGIASHCDNNAGAISGWMLRYATDLTLKAAFNTIETPAGYELSSIWMAGFAPAIDTDGSVFAITGNGNFAKGGKDWGESVIKLPGSLKKVNDFFTPAAYRTLNSGDVDFGSGGVMLLPVQPGQVAPPMAVGMGKDAVLFLLDRTNLGRTKANDTGALQAQRLASTYGGVFGGPAFFAGPAGPLVYYQIGSDFMKAFAVATGTAPALTLASQGTTKAGVGGSMPIVSSNGSAAGTGVVWTIRRSNPLQLEAYDAEHLGAPIYAASAGTWTAGRAFVTPLEANGRVYVPASGTVSVFGLTP